MFKRYVEILSLPGALAFSLAGVVARFPMALVGISTILMIEQLYGNYASAGVVSGASVISFAVGAPILARLVDSYGQARVMIPSITISALAMSGVIYAAIMRAPLVVLIVLAIVTGLTTGSIGSLVRSRWAKVATEGWQIQAAYSMESAFDELVFVVGPILATFLATSVHPTAGLALTIVLTLAGGYWFLLQKKTEPVPTPRPKDTHERSVMLNPTMIVLAITYMGAGALFGANDLAVVAFTKEHGAASLAGAMLAIFALGSLCGALVYGARTWKMPLWKLFGIGILALAIGASTFVFASSLPILGVVMLVTGLVIAPTMTNVNTIVQRIMPSGRLTEGLTWMSTAMNIGVSIGAALSGPLVDSQGSHGGFLVVIASGWCMAAAAFLGMRVLKKSTTQ
ncbi:MFS transporter [Actinomycetaceae bacterium WB03_NA08]|uniref:MFS transporter n=1 Tax=Scrofimicrobium canadense TaxID=2652290 RepID=A0A6N7W8K7_9ACTO|nr:MFS transporter [Scrofimicrobium canadense]MSS84468.1 MFS transporter [Scrofimicrobium canadense]